MVTSFDFMGQARQIMHLQKRLSAEYCTIKTRAEARNFIALATKLTDMAKELAYQAHKNLSGEYRTNAENFAYAAMDYCDIVICEIARTPCLDDVLEVS